LLGAGDIPIPIVNPSGVSGAIQFSDGSAFSSDAANLFWDDANNRLGIGTNAPTREIDVVGTIRASSSVVVGGGGLTLQSNFLWGQSAGIRLRVDTPSLGGVAVNTTPISNVTTLIRGWGSTSATTSLLVRNSAGVAALTVRDNLTLTLGGVLTTSSNITSTANVQGGNINALTNVYIGNFQSSLRSNGSGIIQLQNTAENDFNRLQFGGTSASFPAIKRASNNLEIRNADDTFGAGLSVGGSLNASAILQADSTTKGFLPPRMTTTQKNAISSPSSGLQVYDTTLNQMSYYNGSSWINF
jgi:hypothetical protein